TFQADHVAPTTVPLPQRLGQRREQQLVDARAVSGRGFAEQAPGVIRGERQLHGFAVADPALHRNIPRQDGINGVQRLPIRQLRSQFSALRQVGGRRVASLPATPATRRRRRPSGGSPATGALRRTAGAHAPHAAAGRCQCSGCAGLRRSANRGLLRGLTRRSTTRARRFHCRGNAAATGLRRSDGSSGAGCRGEPAQPRGSGMNAAAVIAGRP
nr:hypothetical protein [Tanacetum cinerariifolium]